MGDLPLCPEPRTTARATGREGAGEVSRGHSSGDRFPGLREGLNLQMQGAAGEDRGWNWPKQTASPETGQRGPRRGGEAEPTCCARGGSIRSRHLARNGPWRLTTLLHLKKPPYTTSTYGGVGGRGRETPPTRLWSVVLGSNPGWGDRVEKPRNLLEPRPVPLWGGLPTCGRLPIGLPGFS